MSNELFAFLICGGFFIAMVLYGAGLLISLRSGFTRSIHMPPMPPILDEVKDDSHSRT